MGLKVRRLNTYTQSGKKRRVTQVTIGNEKIRFKKIVRKPKAKRLARKIAYS